MSDSKESKHLPAPLGYIEPHAHFLELPSPGQLLYKVMTVDNLLRSISGSYLHFNRVDSYSDFPGADSQDGQQLPADKPGNINSGFEANPEFTAADYYDQSRARTYACCFSLENSDVIWNRFAKNSEHGKVCIVFDFEKLRQKLNNTLTPGNAALVYNNKEECKQIFSINYGIMEYVDWNSHQTNIERAANPIQYTYLKDRKGFAEENEFRISLSALGIGHFILNDKRLMQFHTSLQMGFSFHTAIIDQTIQQILTLPETDPDYLKSELDKLDIQSREDGL